MKLASAFISNQIINTPMINHIPPFVKRCEPYRKAIRVCRKKGMSRLALSHLFYKNGIDISQQDIIKWEAKMKH